MFQQLPLAFVCRVLNHKYLTQFSVILLFNIFLYYFSFEIGFFFLLTSMQIFLSLN